MRNKMFLRILATMLISVMILCIAICAARSEERQPPYFTTTPTEALFNMWSNGDIRLFLTNDRTAVFMGNGNYATGTFDVDGDILYIDIDAPRVWPYDHKMNYAFVDDALILRGKNDTLVLFPELPELYYQAQFGHQECCDESFIRDILLENAKLKYQNELLSRTLFDLEWAKEQYEIGW